VTRLPPVAWCRAVPFLGLGPLVVEGLTAGSLLGEGAGEKPLATRWR
jgi:hypothetical protein